MITTSALKRAAFSAVFGVAIGFASGTAMAQAPAGSGPTPVITIGALYECPAGQSFRVISCSGTGDMDACDVQTYAGGQPNQRGPAPRAQVLTLTALCRSVAGGAPAAGAGTGRGAAAAAPQVGPAGIKVGDNVEISTALGPATAKVLAISGNQYRVLAPTGVEVTKTYPTELRRIGPLTAYDRANGIYQIKDKVQVLFEGKWVDSEVVTTLGMEYQVTLPGNRLVWAMPEQLRLVTSADELAKPPAAAVKAGQPPKPGLTSCAGKFEGRYAATNGLPYTMEFRAGKVTVNAPMMGGETAECWMGGGKIYLHKPGEAEDIPIDINDDGTLQTPFGEMRKRGS